MHDDEMIDQLLRAALTADAPQLSPGFDDRVMQRVRPRRLTSAGRVVIAFYVVIAAASTVWLMSDLDLRLIAAGIAIGVPVAAGAGAYSRRLVAGQ